MLDKSSVKDRGLGPGPGTDGITLRVFEGVFEGQSPVCQTNPTVTLRPIGGPSNIHTWSAAAPSSKPL